MQLAVAVVVNTAVTMADSRIIAKDTETIAEAMRIASFIEDIRVVMDRKQKGWEFVA